MLDQKLPAKGEFMGDHRDKVLRDVQNLIDNFERVFVAYINENYRSFTEQDLQRLIKDELKQTLLAKFKELTGDPGFTNCDPSKINLIMQKAEEMRDANEVMRDNIHSLGVTVNQLALSSVKLKQEGFINSDMDVHLRDIASSIDKLNHLFNDVYLKVMENDTRINDVKVTCKTAQSYESHLTKFDNLDVEYTKLEASNMQLKKELFEQATEYKKLQEDFEVAQTLADKHMTNDFKLKNME